LRRESRSDATLLYTSHEDGTVKVWDLESKRASGSVRVGDLGRYEWVNATGFTIGPALGAFEVADFDSFEWAGFFFDPETGRLVGDPIVESDPLALADERFVVSFNGEYRIFDPGTGERTYLAGCVTSDPEEFDAVCDETGLPAPNMRVNVSLDGTEILLRDMPLPDEPGPPWQIVDPADLEVVETLEPGGFLDSIDFFTDTWFQGGLGEVVIVLDRPSREEIARFPRLGPRTEISHAGEWLVQAGGDTVMVIDVERWEAETIEFGADFGRVRGMGFSPDDGLLALGGDGTLFIVDLEEAAVVETYPIDGVSDIHWIDSETLLIGTKFGVWATVSRDVADLSELALASLTRGFTVDECATYIIDPCPSTVADVMARYGTS
jgi:hypothetical protein